MEDVPLTGGDTNAPVRRGDAVHRLDGPWTPTVHRLLEHAAYAEARGGPLVEHARRDAGWVRAHGAALGG